MKKHSNTFDVDLANIPLINLRLEYNSYFKLLQNDDFCKQFQGKVKPIETPYLIWLGMKNDFLTLIMQRAILGIESYLAGAVFVETGLPEMLGKDSIDKTRVKRGKIVVNYYHDLPSLVSDDASLKNFDNKLWERNMHFYSEIRNPIFHGMQLSSIKANNFFELYSHVKDLYAWIDTWHDPENIMSGGSSLSLGEQ